MSKNENTHRKEATPPTDSELQTAIPRGQSRREFQVGLFVILGVFSVLTALFLLTDPSTFRGRYLATTVVEDAGGIRKGDPIQMKGVNIGRVHSFTMIQEGVLISLEMEGGWEVPSDSRTHLVSSGILGGRTVVVLPGSSTVPLRAGENMIGETLPGLLDFPPDLGKNAEDVLERIQSLLTASTVDEIQGSARELRSLLEHLSALAEAQGEEVARLTESLNRSAAGLEEASASGGDFASAVSRADSALATVQETSQSLLRASSSLETILSRMEAGEGTLGRLSTDSTLFETLVAAAESLRALTEDVKANPGRYVRVEIF
jgi:phospholipid/cholesterol/gamma-HCH transport system substrate-binding protein